MPLDFGTASASSPSLRDCVKQIVTQAGSIDAATEFIKNTIRDLQLSGDLGVGAAIDSIADVATGVTGQIEAIREGLPLSDVIPASRLLPPINITKTPLDTLNDLKDRCVDFFLNALDQIDPIARLEQLLNLAQQLCSQLNFTALRSVIDKIQQTRQDILQEAVDALATPVEKLAELNTQVINAINTGSQEALNVVQSALDTFKLDQLYGFLNDLDPQEAIGRLKAAINEYTQLGDIVAVRDALDALNSYQAILESELDDVLAPLDALQSELEQFVTPSELLELPGEVIAEAQKKINDALDLDNYEEIGNIVTALDNLQNESLAILQDLDPQTLLGKGVQLLNDALQKADLGRYNRILDEMAQQLCTSQQLQQITALPPLTELGIELPEPLA
jgi:hypothetical protein